MDVDGALANVLGKWLPGPVSSLGSGAFKGSSRYFVALKEVSISYSFMMMISWQNKLGSLSKRLELTHSLSSAGSIVLITEYRGLLGVPEGRKFWISRFANTCEIEGGRKMRGGKERKRRILGVTEYRKVGT